MGRNNKGPQKAVESLVRVIERIRTKLERSRMTSEERAAYIPDTVSYADSSLHDVWDKFPLGVHANNEEAVWDSSASSNTLIVGKDGDKSLTQRNLIFHCILNKDMWDFVGIDLSHAELNPYKQYSSTLRVANTVDDGVTELRAARDEMMKRYALMESLQLKHFRDLSQPPKSLLIMVNDLYRFVGTTGIKTDEGRKQDELKGEALSLLNDIARIGRPAGVHLVLVVEHFRLIALNHELIENCTTRITTCRTDAEISTRMFGSDVAIKIPSVRYRGYVQHYDKGAEFQAYWADHDYLPVSRD